MSTSFSSTVSVSSSSPLNDSISPPPHIRINSHGLPLPTHVTSTIQQTLVSPHRPQPPPVDSHSSSISPQTFEVLPPASDEPVSPSLLSSPPNQSIPTIIIDHPRAPQLPENLPTPLPESPNNAIQSPPLPVNGIVNESPAAIEPSATVSEIPVDQLVLETSDAAIANSSSSVHEVNEVK